MRSLLLIAHASPRLMVLIFSAFMEVSHIIKGLRTLSIDQLLFLQRAGFSASKQASNFTVARKSTEDSLLCSSKNFSLLVMKIKKQLPSVSCK